MLGWSARALSRKADVPEFTIEWIEGDGKIGPKDRQALAAIQEALEAGGIEFTDTVGIQLRPKKGK
jgi:hypothetical protein